MIEEVIRVSSVIRKYRFLLNSEKELQNSMFKVLQKEGFVREFILDKKSVIDFYHPQTKIGIEVKINRGSAMSIYKQCERYCEHEMISGLILATNRSFGFPLHINNKPTLILSLGEAWL